MRARVLFVLAVFLLLCLVCGEAFAQTDTYRFEEYKFSIKIPWGYTQKKSGLAGANVNSFEVMFFNKSTQETIIIALNKNTDEQTKKMYWDTFNNSQASTIMLMKKDREGRGISRQKIHKSSFEGFVTVSENMTHQRYLLQEVKLFPKSGPGSAIVSFLYGGKNHPKILAIIDSIEYNW